MTDGYRPPVACGSKLTRIAQGKNLAEASAIEAADVIVALGGPPVVHERCPTLTMDMLPAAIATYRPEAAGRSE